MGETIAIHDRPRSYSDRWIQYCREKNIPHKVVSCYRSGIIEELREAAALLWHIDQGLPADIHFARHIMRAAEMMGLVVYPNTATCWHFDDKVAQKYLFEVLGDYGIPTFVAYSLEDALTWIDRAQFPKVFKLRRGAGSQNVRLVHSAAQARVLARKAFGQGFPAIASYAADAGVKLRRHRKAGDVLGVLKRLPGVLRSRWYQNRLLGRERGYVLFQDFLPGNTFDTRITVIGDRAFAYTRNVRPNDFRASGSGAIVHDLARIDRECVRIAFEMSAKLGSQSMAFDFIRDGHDRPRVGEISFGFVDRFVHDVSGYWDRQMNWHEGHVWPQDAMIEDVIAEVRRRRA